MSRTYSLVKNKHQKHSKVPYQAYLYNSSEPREHISVNTEAGLEAELLEDIVPMRQEFRHLAHRMRDLYL